MQKETSTRCFWAAFARSMTRKSATAWVHQSPRQPRLLVGPNTTSTRHQPIRAHTPILQFPRFHDRRRSTLHTPILKPISCCHHNLRHKDMARHRNTHEIRRLLHLGATQLGTLTIPRLQEVGCRRVWCHPLKRGHHLRPKDITVLNALTCGEIVNELQFLLVISCILIPESGFKWSSVSESRRCGQIILRVGSASADYVHMEMDHFMAWQRKKHGRYSFCASVSRVCDAFPASSNRNERTLMPKLITQFMGLQ